MDSRMAIDILRNANLGGVLRQAADYAIGLLEAQEQGRLFVADCNGEGKRMAEWISVKERLPECEFECVLVCTETGRVGEATVDEYAEFGWAWAGEEGIEVDEPVTHWMPLPEPPKGGCE